MNTQFRFQRYLAEKGYPPSFWTHDLDGLATIVTLLDPLPFGKWRAIDEDADPIIIAEEHLGEMF